MTAIRCMQQGYQRQQCVPWNAMSKLRQRHTTLNIFSSPYPCAALSCSSTAGKLYTTTQHVRKCIALRDHIDMQVWKMHCEPPQLFAHTGLDSTQHSMAQLLILLLISPLQLAKVSVRTGSIQQQTPLYSTWHVRNSNAWIGPSPAGASLWAAC